LFLFYFLCAPAEFYILQPLDSKTMQHSLREYFGHTTMSKIIRQVKLLTDLSTRLYVPRFFFVFSISSYKNSFFLVYVNTFINY